MMHIEEYDYPYGRIGGMVEYAVDSIREAKKVFMGGDGSVPSGALRAEIIESWERSREAGLSPSDIPQPTELRHLPVLDENLWLGEYVIKETLEDFYSYVESLDGMVFFAYDEKVIIDFASGKRPDCMKDLPLQPGVSL